MVTYDYSPTRVNVAATGNLNDQNNCVITRFINLG